MLYQRRQPTLDQAQGRLPLEPSFQLAEEGS